MIYLTQNQPSSAYTTALENYTGVTNVTGWTFTFVNDSTNYTYTVSPTLVNSGNTLNRYEEFYFTSGNTAFEFLGYYTYTIKNSVTNVILETGRAKVSSTSSNTVVENKPKYKETSPKKKTYKS